MPVYDEDGSLLYYEKTLFNQHEITPPDSGEDEMLILWICLTAAALAGIAVTGFIYKKKKEELYSR
ncbi:MAG: LPXTG cell wall anchor domain-containing protein [Lachnospiraceae bacterium]|nr:LPXTG cell wall anchor domain-containing protein [Lachnospiraceae bacterium]